MNIFYQMAIEADRDWQTELVKVYGVDAGDARYDERGTATSLLSALCDRKIQRDALWRQEMRKARRNDTH